MVSWQNCSIQMKWYCLLFLLWPATAQTVAPTPLIEIYRDAPQIQDEYRIFSFGDHEELDVNANAAWLPRQEYGRYLRMPTGLAAQVDKLEAGYSMPEQRTFDLTGWHALIKGEEIDAGDPRYQKLFNLFARQMKQDGWRRKDVTIATVKRMMFKVARLQYPARPSRLTRPHITRQTLDGLETCPKAMNGHLVCQLADGFILLANPGDRRN